MDPELADAFRHLRALGVAESLLDPDPHQLADVLSEHILLGGPATMTAREVAAASDADEDTVRRLWRAVGFPDPGERCVFRDIDIALVRRYMEGVAFFGPDAMEHFARVIGASTRAIAEAGHAIFYEAGKYQADPSLAERLQMTETGGRLAVTISDAVTPLLLRHLQATRTWFRPRASGDPLLSAAVGFCDLVGSTALANTVEPESFAEALTRFELAATRIASASAGRVVKFVGDEVMFAAADVDAATSIATSVLRWVGDDEVLTRARGAIAFGPVLPRDGDLFGPTVNLAARLASVAPDGSVVIADEDGTERRSVRGFDRPVTTRTVTAGTRGDSR